MQIQVRESVSIAAISSDWYWLLVGLILEARPVNDPEVQAAFAANHSSDPSSPRVEILGGEHWEAGFAVRGKDFLSVLVSLLPCVPGLDGLLSWLVQHRPGIRDGWIIFAKRDVQEFHFQSVKVQSE